MRYRMTRLLFGNRLLFNHLTGRQLAQGDDNIFVFG